MKTDTIKAIFTNVLFLIGVILLIIGGSRGLLTLTRVVVFESYPLDPYAETRCNVSPIAPVEGEIMPRPDVNCLENLEHERRVKLTDDAVGATTMLIAGFILTFGFKRFIFGDGGIIKRHPKIS